MQALKPKNVSKEESMILVKNMIRISISTICYFRDLFPNECFKTKQYGPIEIHQLQGAKKDEKTGEITILHNDSFLVSQWLERGVFAALDLEYVSSLLFAIYTKDPRNGADLLLETYEFKITYPSPDQHAPQVNDVDLASKDAVKSQAAKLVRSLTEFSSTLDNLPEERWLTIELKYTDNTPAEYQPEFFCSSEQGLTANRTFPLIVNIGHVKTSGLEMKLKYAGFESLLMEDIMKENPMVAPPAPSILRGQIHDPNAITKKTEAETANSLPLHVEALPVAETKPTEMEIEQKLDDLNLSQKSDDSTNKEGISRRTIEEIKVFIGRREKATMRRLENELFLDKKVLEKTIEYMMKKKILTKSGSSYYIDQSHKSRQEKESEKGKVESNKAAPTITPPIVAPKPQPAQEPVKTSKVPEPPPMLLSQDSITGSALSRIRKFGVIRDPLQVFQDHKRRRT